MDVLAPEPDPDREGIDTSDEMPDEINSELDSDREEIESSDKQQHRDAIKKISDEDLETFDPEIRILVLKYFPNRLIDAYERKICLALQEPNNMLKELTLLLSDQPDSSEPKLESLKKALDRGKFANHLENTYVATENTTHGVFGSTEHPLITDAHITLLVFILKALRIVLGRDELKSRLNKRGPSGKLILTEAILCGHVSVVHKLLSYGADPGEAKAWQTIDQLRHEYDKMGFFNPPPLAFSQQIRDMLDWSKYSKLGPVYVRASYCWYFDLWTAKRCVDSRSWAFLEYLKEDTFLLKEETYLPKNQPRIYAYDEVRPSSASVNWIHAPTTNGLVILTILREIGADVEKIFYERLREPSSPPLDLLLKYREPEVWKGQVAGADSAVAYAPVTCNVVVFPCLALTTIKRYKEQREKHKDLKRRFSRNECPIYFERTLDEAYCPRLSNDELHTRNEEQIVSRSTRKWKADQESSPKDRDAPILMVAELWLWRVGNTIVSASSLSEASTILKRADEERAKASPLSHSADLVNFIQQPYPEIQLGMIIASFIDGFGQGYSYTDTKHPSTLDLFDVRVQSLLSELRGYMTKRQRDLDYKQEQYFLLDILDVRSELAMIHSVLKQQEQVLRDLMNDCTSSESSKDCTPSESSNNCNSLEPPGPLNSGQKLAGLPELAGSPKLAGLPDWSTFKHALVTLERYQQRVGKIDGDAERVEKAVQDLLNLKRTFASMEDTRSSLILSKAVIGFTLVTIIFAPLAFLTALFALKVKGFGRLQLPGLDGVYDSGKLGGVLLSSVVLTLALTGGFIWAVSAGMRYQDEKKNGIDTSKKEGGIMVDGVGKNADGNQMKKTGMWKRPGRWVRSKFPSRKPGLQTSDEEKGSRQHGRPNLK